MRHHRHGRHCCFQGSEAKSAVCRSAGRDERRRRTEIAQGERAQFDACYRFNGRGEEGRGGGEGVIKCATWIASGHISTPVLIAMRLFQARYVAVFIV